MTDKLVLFLAAKFIHLMEECSVKREKKQTDRSLLDFKCFILEDEILMQRLLSVLSWQLLDKNESGDVNGFSICTDDFRSVMGMFLPQFPI